MAKKKKAPPRKRLSQKIKDEERKTRYESAIAKEFRNLNTYERQAVEDTHWMIFEEEFASVLKTRWAEVLNTTLTAIGKIAKSRGGLPWPKRSKERIDGFAFITFLWEYFCENTRESMDGAAVNNRGDVVELVATDPQMKTHLANEKLTQLKMQNAREQVKLQKLAESHIPTAKVQAEMATLASMIAKRREDLGRKIPDEPYHTMVQQAFEDMADEAETRGKNLEGDDDL